MECCDIDECHFVQYKPAVPGYPGTDPQPGVLDICQVKRDRDWWAKVFPIVEAFHEMLVNYRPGAVPAPKKRATATTGNKRKRAPVIEDSPSTAEEQEYMFADPIPTKQPVTVFADNEPAANQIIT